MEPSHQILEASVPLPAAVRQWALLIDFDACIVPAGLSANANGHRGSHGAGASADMPPQVRYALARLFQALGGAVVLITGQSLIAVDRQVGMPDLPIAAGNGLEVRALRKAAAAPVLRATTRLAAPTRADLVRRLMESAPFTGRTPVYLGRTGADEPAFAAVRGLGGFVIAVGNAQSLDSAKPGKRMIDSGSGEAAWPPQLATPRAARALLCWLADVAAGGSAFAPA